MQNLKPNPFIITHRPFAVEPVTGIMLPDGIFDCTIGRLDIFFYIKNNSNKNFNTIHYGLETYSPKDFRIVGIRGGVIRNFLPNSTVLVHFEADFSKSSAGEKELMIWISGDYVDYKNKNHLKKIFVTKTTYDSTRKIYICETDAGNFEQSFAKVATSSKGEIFNSDYKGNLPQIFIPLSVKTHITPFLPFSAPYESLPYKDPLWKVIAWIIAGIAAIGAYIAAKNGQGTMSIGIAADNTADDNYKICNPHLQGLKESSTLAGALSIVANAAIVVGLMHYRDPWIIGREQSNLALGEKIIEEDVSFELLPTFPIIAGTPNKVKADWKYEAKTNFGNNILIKKTQEAYNQDIADEVKIMAPTKVIGLNPIIVGLKVYKSIVDNIVYKPDEIFAYCLLVSPSPLRKEYRIILQDNGVNYDNAENDGWFQGGVHLEELLSDLTREEMTGDWTAYFFAQIVNSAPENSSVEEATGYIGGNFIAHPMSIEKSSSDHCTWQKFLRYIGVSFS